MEQHDDWTPEERAALRHLLGTPGWELVLRVLLIPALQQLTGMLDRPTVDQDGRGDYLRGQKRATLHLLDQLYTAARVTNPLAVHALALLQAVSREPVPPLDAPSPSPAAAPEGRHGHRHVPV